ncbi:MAG: hypothetical protein IH628_01780, partial [Proteobacteria bacterium]|nr:hypothetical protein [Pseudomonadota bacterium]
MKKYLVLLSAFCFLFGSYGATHAYTIDTNFTADDNEYTSFYFPTTEDFNGALVWTWSPSEGFAIVTGDSLGFYSAPAGVDGINKDETEFVTVPAPTTNGNAYVDVTGLPISNFFGLWWGSMDSYNTLRFYKGGVATGDVVTGDTVRGVATPSGDQLAEGSNHYVNFFGLKDYDGFRMESTSFAFEADNMSIGYVVPEPTT